MSVRTTVELVGGICEVDEDIDLTPFIESASAMVDDCCLDSGYTDVKLELIERWLSACFYCMRELRVGSESIGISTSYQSSIGLGLDHNQYGQMAKRLDSAGGLAALDEKIKRGTTGRPGVFWLGTE